MPYTIPYLYGEQLGQAYMDCKLNNFIYYVVTSPFNTAFIPEWVEIYGEDISFVSFGPTIHVGTNEPEYDNIAVFSPESLNNLQNGQVLRLELRHGEELLDPLPPNTTISLFVKNAADASSFTVGLRMWGHSAK